MDTRDASASKKGNYAEVEDGDGVVDEGKNGENI